MAIFNDTSSSFSYQKITVDGSVFEAKTKPSALSPQHNLSSSHEYAKSSSAVMIESIKRFSYFPAISNANYTDLFSLIFTTPHCLAQREDDQLERRKKLFLFCSIPFQSDLIHAACWGWRFRVLASLVFINKLIYSSTSSPSSGRPATLTQQHASAIRGPATGMIKSRAAASNHQLSAKHMIQPVKTSDPARHSSTRLRDEMNTDDADAVERIKFIIRIIKS